MNVKYVKVTKIWVTFVCPIQTSFSFLVIYVRCNTFSDWFLAWPSDPENGRHFETDLDPVSDIFLTEFVLQTAHDAKNECKFVFKRLPESN